MTEDQTNAAGDAVDVFPAWILRQTLKTVPTPGYSPDGHAPALMVIADRLMADTSIANGKLSDSLKAVIADPSITRSQLTESVFNGNSGYTLGILWPLVSIFTGRMPRRVGGSTGRSYAGWLGRIRRVVIKDLDAAVGEALSEVLDAVEDAYAQASINPSSGSAEVARSAEDVTERVNVEEPGIYVFSTPTYLAYPPFGWNTDDLSRQDFRYLKTGSTTVDMQGRVHSEIGRQTGLPEPYLIVAKFQSETPGSDYVALERGIHRVLGEARHGPEEDGTRRSRGRGAGTEWFVTRLPLVVAIAESLGLRLAMSDDIKSQINDVFDQCELPDWALL